MNEIQIKELFFKKTCDCCPEQYDIYKIEDDFLNKIGYIRLRYGTLEVYYFKNTDDLIEFNRIYYEELKDIYGEFRDDAQRRQFLNKIYKKMVKYL